MSNYESATRPNDQGERLQRDTALVDRIQSGYTPAERSEQMPHPRIVDGALDEDAMSALGELYTHYEKLSGSIARRFVTKAHNRTSLDFEDLRNQAYFGIYHAAVTFDSERAASFTTHAFNSVSSHLSKYVSEHDSLIRLPSQVRGSVNKYGKTIWTLYQNQERYPVRERVAKAMGLNPREIEELALLEAETTQMGSIDEGYYTDGRDRKTTLEAGEGKWRSAYSYDSVERIVDEEATSKVFQEVVGEVLREQEDSGDISRRGALVIRLRFFGTNENDYQPMHLDEVAKILSQLDEFHYTRERVRQIEARTLAILRHPKVADRIRPYIEAA